MFSSTEGKSTVLSEEPKKTFAQMKSALLQHKSNIDDMHRTNLDETHRGNFDVSPKFAVIKHFSHQMLMKPKDHFQENIGAHAKT